MLDLVHFIKLDIGITLNEIYIQDLLDNHHSI